MKKYLLLLSLVCSQIFSQTVEYSGTRIFKGILRVTDAATFDFKGTEIDSIVVYGDSLYFYVDGNIYKALQEEYDPVYLSSVASEISAQDTNDYRDAVDSLHNHDNKGVLDGISAADTNNWSECKLNTNISKSGNLNYATSNVTLTAYVNTEGVSYSWNSGDGTGKTYIVTTAGNYDLIVSKAGCIDDTAYIYVPMTNLENDYGISTADTNNYRAYIDDSANVLKWTDTILVDNKKIITKHDLDTSLANLDFVLGESVLFLHSETSDISGYNQLLIIAEEDPEATNNAVVNSGSGEVLIKSFVTNQLKINAINSGVWTFMSFISVDNATGTTTVVIRVYKRSGGIETELFNITTPEINGTSATEYDIETVQSDYAILTTDSLVVKYFAQTTSGVNRTVTLFYEGSANYTHIHTPIVISLTESDPIYAGDSADIVMFSDTNTVIATKTDLLTISDSHITDSTLYFTDPVNGNYLDISVAPFSQGRFDYYWSDPTFADYINWGVQDDGFYFAQVKETGTYDWTAKMYITPENTYGTDGFQIVAQTSTGNGVNFNSGTYLNYESFNTGLSVLNFKFTTDSGYFKNGSDLLFQFDATKIKAPKDLLVNRKLTVNDSSDIKTAMTTWHRNDSINTPTADVWTNIKLDTMIADLTTYGFTTPDSINFISSTNGIFESNGIMNQHWYGTTAPFTSYIRTLKNSVEIKEAKSRINLLYPIGNEEFQHNINGRTNIIPGDTIRFQYYISDTNLDFDCPNAVFDDEPVIMINIKKISK